MWQIILNIMMYTETGKGDSGSLLYGREGTSVVAMATPHSPTRKSGNHMANL